MGTQSTIGTGGAGKDKVATGRVLSLKPSLSPSHSHLNPSRIVSLSRRCLLLELLQASLPLLLQLLPERPQLLAVQLQADTLPQPAAPTWGTAVPREKPAAGILRGIQPWATEPQRCQFGAVGLGHPSPWRPSRPAAAAGLVAAPVPGPSSGSALPGPAAGRKTTW